MTSLVAQAVKNLPTMLEIWVGPLDQKDPLEKEIATHSNVLTWEILWTDKSGGIQSMESQTVGHSLATKQHNHL